MTQERPAPEQYLAFPKAIAALRDRITGTTDREIACWIFFGQIKAYSHVHEFPEPPEFNLAGLALTGWPSASKENPPFITALDEAFFRIADVEDFTPSARYIAFADLLQRWIPHRESQESTASFIHSRIHQSRLHDFAPWLGETELSRVFFPSLPDDWERPRPPAEWAMFNLAEVEAIEASDFPNEEQATSLQQGDILEKNRSIPSPNLQSGFVFDPLVAETENGLRKLILENWIAMSVKYGPSIKAAQIHRYICAIDGGAKNQPSLQSVHNRLGELRKENKLPKKT